MQWALLRDMGSISTALMMLERGMIRLAAYSYDFNEYDFLNVKKGKGGFTSSFL